MNRMVPLLAITLLMLAPLAMAEIPGNISYQGLLKTAGGEAVNDGDYIIGFALYDEEEGGSALWTESQTLPVTDGVFHAILGIDTPIDLDFNDGYWLGIAIEEDPELAPRIQLTASAYALNSERLGGLAAPSYALVGHAHLLADLTDVDITDAADGEVLTYDSEAGNWTASSTTASADSDWTVDGINMYSNVTGNIGIGTQTPQLALDIRKDYNYITGLRIQNNDPGASSSECLYFSDENGNLAGIRTQDADHTSGPNRMYIFNARDNGSIEINSSTAKVFLDGSTGNVGIGTTYPMFPLEVDGTASLGGLVMPDQAAAGHVLTSDASGNASWQAPAEGGDEDWSFAGDDIYRVLGSVGIGSLPLRPAPETSKGETPSSRNPASEKLLVTGSNEGIFCKMTETNADNDDRAAIYGYRTRTAQNDGSGFSHNSTNAAVIGANYWGDSYTFGVAGFCYNDHENSAGVFGSDWSGSYWAALGYKDSNLATWGIYTPGKAHVGDRLDVEEQINAYGTLDAVGNFGSGHGGSAINAENTNASGIALWAETHGADATAVFDQNGTGDIMRGFLNGSLKFRVLNDGSVVTPVLHITGGSDLAEPFEVTDEGEVEAGALLVIDDKNPGKLKLSEKEYDCRVAGVVSGAGGVNPGLTLSQKGVFERGENLALSGRAYAMADASNGPIHPGDLLTTSSKPGHAMKATDRDRSHGAIIGKAMTSLEEGTGLVLVLVNLQ